MSESIGGFDEGNRNRGPGAGETTELSIRAVALGLLLSAVLGAANVYLGLKVGMTVSASIPAAVVAMLLLRKVFRGGTLLEANQVQTAASAGESLAAGILFTVPALVMIGAWGHFDYWATTWIAIAGGWLGVLFMIPMRRVFIEDSPELPYPEGVACAAVLRSADDGASAEEGGSVLRGGLLGAVIKVGVAGLGLFQSSVESAVSLFGGRVFFLGADLSPALLAVGYIVRLEVAAQIFVGGALGWLILIPLAPEWLPLLASDSKALAEALENPVALDQAWALWSKGIRYIGVGAMAVGGLAALVRVRSGLARALVELRRGYSEVSGASDERVDLSGRVIALCSLFAVGIVAVLYARFTEDLAMAAFATVIMVVAAFFFVGVASYIVGLVGNSNSPVSGMTITAVLATGALLWLFGYRGLQGMVATLGVAAVVCCAACTAGDVCNDLKTGALVGATPRRQQTMQLLGVVVAALVMAPVLQLLHNAYGIGSRELAAPQASLFASLARGFFGEERLPWGLVALGSAIGLLILALDGLLERRNAAFRLHLMPVAVGLYLPFGLALPILFGGLFEWFGRERSSDSAANGSQRGILFASGVVAGEALIGVAVAIWIGVGGKALALGFDGSSLVLTSLAAAFLTLGLFYRGTRTAS